MDSSQLVLSALYRRAALEFPDKLIVSVLDGTTTTRTYRDFFDRVDRLAHGLRALGVGPGDRVGTLAWNDVRHLELYVAVTRSGAVLHTINARLAADQVAEVVRHAGDVVLFYDAEFEPTVADLMSATPALRARVRLGPGTANTAVDGALDYEALLVEQSSTVFDYPTFDENMPAATSYSSATTGSPKGVVYTHRGLVLHSMMLGLADTWGLSQSDTILPVVPMFHVNAWGIPFAALWFGANLVLPGPRPDATTIAGLIAEFDVSVAAAVPTVWMEVFGAAERDSTRLSSLRLAVCGGAPLPRSLIRAADRLDVGLVHAYGMTEASPLVLVGTDGSDASSEDRESLRLRQGRAVPGVEYTIVDEEGHAVARNGSSPGELLLRGWWIAEEYQRDERSRDAFVDGWYRTGDIVTITELGYMQVVDRRTDMIKSGGEWISSVDLENALMEHPSVSMAAVVGMPDEHWQERPLAFVVPAAACDPATLRAHLESRFPRFWLPDEIVVVDSVPLTSVGKFDKRALRQRVADRSV